eukprot:CAMPEP_0176406368 /NCGR_PEP_ID=MMETSP0127-20121128/838_1 /TAXON_ID=938130 /ORGANISM="Platyophrya macrostoma, Strain WH" /LENGTH=390 /DNA_ID=CAMNT_0017785497 /DNA_START=189 /DNA_END=1357 /DNA_ORIENTATION=-
MTIVSDNLMSAARSPRHHAHRKNENSMMSGAVNGVVDSCCLESSLESSQSHPQIPRYHPDDVQVQSTAIIGRGGNRGAIVIATEHPVRALKVYQHQRIPENEYEFMIAVWSWIRRHPLYSGGDKDPILASLALQHFVVFPLGITLTPDGDDHGIMMPMLSRSMFDFLRSTHPLTDHHGTLLQHVTDDDEATHPVFRAARAFEPIRFPLVIAAVLYQTVLGVRYLHTELPHVAPDGLQKKGFSHNDLHLSNLLVHYDTGSVLLCDFELVHHVPPLVCSGSGPANCAPPRAPPRGRAPPTGCFSPETDTWGIGLLAVSEAAFDDFGDGPLLLPAQECDNVIDWDRNLGAFVEDLLLPVRGGDEDHVYEALLAFCRRCLTNSVDERPPSIDEL